MTQPDAAPTAEPRVGRLIVAAALVGIAASFTAVLFVVTERWLQHALWSSVPEAAGWAGTPWWWVAAVLLAGAVLTWAARRLPGDGGHTPLDEMAFTIHGVAIVSVVLAALASLAAGAVVGPEAPLVAVGTATAGLLYRADRPGEGQILLAAGGAAAIGLILGNPLITAILVLEGAVLKGSPGGKAAMVTLMPVMVALGFGYVVQVGVGDWGGFGESVLTVPGLPAYPEVQLRDVLVGVAVAVAVGLLAVISLRIGRVVSGQGAKRQLPVLIAAAATVAVLAVATDAITGQGVEVVLFSGQAAIPQVLGVASVGTLAVIAVAKMLAYGVSIGGGFRGGRIFPAVFLGVVGGTAAATMVTGTSVAALVACGIGAGAGAVLRLPFSSALLAVLLCSAAGLAVTTLAITGAIVGILVRVAADRAAEDETDRQAVPAP